MIVSINQPAYLPWLGYFHRIAQSGLHIVLDHVQFEKNSFTNRNKIRTSEGWTWLTIPVKTKGHFGDLAIQSLETDSSSNWRDKHWKTLSQNYAKTPFWKTLAPSLEALYAKPWTHLAELCREMNSYFLKELGIQTPLQYSSQMQSRGVKDELVLNLCKEVKADVYLSGALGRDYLREPLFNAANIKVIYQDYRHPVYRQRDYRSFEPYMGIIDLLSNHGPDSLKLLLEGQEVVV